MRRIVGCVVWGVLLCLSVPVCAAITASIQPNPVLQGEALYLTFESDKSFKQEPDLNALSPLFQITGRQQRQQSRVLNGVLTVNYQLVYTLFPKKDGTLSVPDIRVDGQNLTIQPVQVIQSGAESKGGAVGSVMTLTGQVSKSRIYQGESFLYTVRLSDSVGIVDGQIEPPAVANAAVVQVGADKTFTEIQNGQRVRVFERSFMITPETAGTVVVPQVHFSGVRTEGGRQPSLADLFDAGILFDGLNQKRKEVFLSTAEMRVQVLPKPQNWTGWWLPSTRVILTEIFDVPTDLMVGQPLERQFELVVDGVSADRLPVPTQADSVGVNVYPSPEKRETQVLPDGNIQGRVHVVVALVPTQAGPLQVPAVSIQWFNTQTGMTEQATVPAREISVASNPKATESDTGRKSDVSEAVSAPVLTARAAVSIPESAQQTGGWLIFWAVIGGILGGISLAALGVFIYVRRQKKTGYAGQKNKKPLPDLYPF